MSHRLCPSFISLGLHLCSLFCLNKMLTFVVHNIFKAPTAICKSCDRPLFSVFLGGSFGCNGRTQRQQRRIREHVLVDQRVQALWGISREHKHYFGGL